MSTTPVEGDGSEGESGPASRDVRGRLRAFVRSVSRRIRRGLRTLLGGGATDGVQEASESDRSTAGTGTAIRVGGQRRLEGDRAAPPAVSRADGGEPRPAVPPRRETSVEGQIDGGRFRVYDAERSEAYVESDYWEQIRK